MRFGRGGSFWRILLAVLVIQVLAGAPAGADAQDDLARIENYLNDLESLRASFVQIAPDGAMSKGRLFYERPDKMRLDYDPPNDIQIIASGVTLVYRDRRLGQENRLFASQTPLAFLLEDEIRLDDGLEVVNFERRRGELLVSVVQADDPNEGRVTLAFREEPLQLRHWAVTDAQGLTTQIFLEDVETGVPLDDGLFSILDPGGFPGDRR